MPAETAADNRFAIEDLVASGGMGTVYRARDRETGDIVALKLMSTGHAVRFEREARVLAELEHPGIVRYVAHGVLRGQCWLAMEWLEGEDLEQRLARGPIEQTLAVALVRRVADALAFAHKRGVIHRDVKPSNVMLIGGDLNQVKLIDFGIARVTGGSLQTVAGAVIGTPAYMAPEQARGALDVDARADVYSLGCILFHCLTGRPPLAGENMVATLAKTLFEEPPRLSELLPSVTSMLDALVARMLAKSPDERPAHAGIVAIELFGSLEATEPLPARRASARAPSGDGRSLTVSEQRLVSLILFAVEREQGSALFDLEAVRGAVTAFGGRLEALQGGAIAVLFSGAVEHAATCALALKDAIRPRVMALATGRANVAHRLPVGDVIDRAARLIETNGKDGIRLDEITETLLRDRFEVAGGILLGRREVEPVRTVLGKRTPFVGRHSELSQLESLAIDSALESRAVAALVTGDAGSGKSRLRRELVDRVRRSDESIEIWMGRGDPVGAGSAFALAAQFVRKAAGVLEGEPVTVRKTKLAARVARYVPLEQRRRITVLLGEMIGVPFHDDDDAFLRSARSDLVAMGDHIRLAFQDFVEWESRAHPLMIILEDLQWGDRPTVSLVLDTLSAFPECPIFLLALGRPEAVQAFPEIARHRGAAHLQLSRLSPRACERIARAVLPAGTGDEPVLALVERAGGNPFFLEELMRSFAEGRTDVPETALMLVESRVARLEPEARRVLRAASVFGSLFWDGGVAELVGDLDAARLWLEVLERRELIRRQSESTFAGEIERRFAHSLVRDAAYAMLTSEDRVLGHRLAAAFLEQKGVADATAVAEHLELAGESARAASAWKRAAEQALEGNDLGLALARAERGVCCGAQGELFGLLRRLQAEAHRWRGENQLARARAAEALGALVPQSDAWAGAAAELCNATLRLGRRDELELATRRLHDLLDQGDSRPALVVAACRNMAGWFTFGDHRYGSRLLERVERFENREPRAAAWLETARAWRDLFDGRTGGFVRRMARAVEIFDGAGHMREATAQRINVGIGLLLLGVFPQSVSVLRAAIATAARLGLQHDIWAARVNLGWGLLKIDHLDEGLTLIREAMEVFEQQGNRRMESSAHIYLADHLLECGDFAAAGAEAERAVELASIAPGLRARALALRARALLANGLAAEAVNVASEALRELDNAECRVEDGEALTLIVTVEALLANGEIDAAKRVLKRAHDRLDERASTIDDPMWKQAFLENVPDHVQTLALARRYLQS